MWGAGIARVFRDKVCLLYFPSQHSSRHLTISFIISLVTNEIKTHQYPQAHIVYKSHCDSQTGNALLGTTLLIPPQAGDGNKKQWIACLFTSVDYGRKKGTPDSIVAATRGALEDLKVQLDLLKGGADGNDDQSGKEKGKQEVTPGELWACRFNSKNFGVPWARSRRAVEEVGLVMNIVEIA